MAKDPIFLEDDLGCPHRSYITKRNIANKGIVELALCTLLTDLSKIEGSDAPCSITLSRAHCLKCIAAGGKDVSNPFLKYILTRTIRSRLNLFRNGRVNPHMPEGGNSLLMVDDYLGKLKALGENPSELRKYIYWLQTHRNLQAKEATPIVEKYELDAPLTSKETDELLEFGKKDEI